MAIWPDDDIVILSHMNVRGHFADNLSSSLYTGESLERRLERASVERSRLSVEAYGEARLDDDDEEEPSRRYLLELVWKTDGWCNAFPGCPAGSWCVEDRCTGSCGDGLEGCPDGWVCDDGECAMCLEDEHCGPGRSCVSRFCVECRAHADCPQGTICDGDSCREPEHGLCQAPEDCEGEEVLCLEGICQEICRDDGLGYCHQTSLGVWGIQLRDMRISMDMGRHSELRARWFITIFTTEGVRLTWSPDSDRDDYQQQHFVETDITTGAVDLNGDGVEELWVEMAHSDLEVGVLFDRHIVTFDGDRTIQAGATLVD